MENKINEIIASLNVSNEEKEVIKQQSTVRMQNDEQNNVRRWREHLHTLVETYNREQDDESVNNLLKVVGDYPQNSTHNSNHSKNQYRHYNNPRKRYHRR